jgi:single-strand selective monofunctional uracil DNA glycosylase
VCDAALRRILDVLEPRLVIGVGRFAQARARAVCGGAVGYLPHPSPASPRANRDWGRLADAALADLRRAPGRRDATRRR